MGWPVVIVSSGGLPVTEAANGFGAPVDVASNGFGTPVTVVASGGLPVVGSGGSTPTPSLKKLVAIDANNFQINQTTPTGKVMGLTIIRNQGTNDAGTAHEPWRLGPAFQLDALTDLISAGGWKALGASNGAQDYARNRGAPINSFGGSTHGGETNVSEVIKADGVTITGLVNVDARVFEFVRTTTITWSDASTATVVYTMTIGEDMKVSQTIQHSSAATMGSLDYPTLGFPASRFSRIITSAGTVNMNVSGNEYDIDTSIRSIRLMDPTYGDTFDFDFTIDIPVNRIFVWWNTTNDYSKLYVKSAGGVIPTINVTQKRTYSIAALPTVTLPYTDPFDGSALLPIWRQVDILYPLPAANSVVTGGEWVLTNVSAICRFAMPLNFGAGVYRIELDYKTDAANTGSILNIVRSDYGGANNPILAAQNLNSTAGTTFSYDLTITAGQTPFLLITTGVSGRVTRFRELRITKLS